MNNQLTVRIKNAFAEIPAAIEAVSRWLSDREVPASVGYVANLAIEELATNSVKYAYEDTGTHFIEFNMTLAANELVILMTDDGRPFNPLDLPEPDLTLPVELRPVGGLGVHLLRKMADGMEYEHRDGRNRITLRKSLVSGKSTAPSAGRDRLKPD